MGVYEIRFAEGVEKDLKKIPAYYRKTVLDAIATQLVTEPATLTRNRKQLVSLIPPWTAEAPVWELRVGDYRIFYDVTEEEPIVYVRAIRKKFPGKRTEDIL